jgi:hypothetical protein
MYPNPQDVLPLPPRPSLEQYKKRAKELVKACRSGDADAIGAWALRWIDAEHSTKVEQFARERLRGTCALADAQFVIARAYGFASWPKFVTHLELLARAASPVSSFEEAADAIVAGDERTLSRLLRDHPELVRARSTRDHRSTLLHYVSANGVENYRQKSPRNAAAIARLLLDNGAEVDAEADVYGGGCTALGLVATSAPPSIAGVQLALLDVLLERGARLDRPGAAGHRHPLVRACLANGQPDAARYLARRGAPLDLVGAAGIGDLDAVRTSFDEQGRPAPNVSRADLLDAFAYACGYGHAAVVGFLLDQGVDVNATLRLYGDGHTGTHLAAYHAHIDVLEQLLARGANLDVVDTTWGTPPVVWALTGWHEKAGHPRDRHYEAVAMLVIAGAAVKAEWLEDEQVRADARMREALTPRPKPR